MRSQRGPRSSDRPTCTQQMDLRRDRSISRGAFSKALSHFNDTVEIYLIKRDGRWRLSYHPRDRSSVHYDAQNNCLTGWKDESRPVTLDYRSRRDAASEEQRDSRHANQRLRENPRQTVRSVAIQWR